MSAVALRAARDEVTRALFDRLRADGNHDALREARVRLGAACREYNALCLESNVARTFATETLLTQTTI